MHIVLVEPEIPGNTGNIARLCAAEHLTLHLVEPLGFQIDDKHLKRAGLDYWDLLDVHVHPNYDSVVRMLAGHHFYLRQKRYVPIQIFPMMGTMYLSLGKKRKDFPRNCCGAIKKTVSAYP